MSKLMLTVAAVALALCESGIAQFVPVEWDATCQFSKELPVQPGKFVEAREKLPKGAKVPGRSRPQRRWISTTTTTRARRSVSRPKRARSPR